MAKLQNKEHLSDLENWKYVEFQNQNKNIEIKKFGHLVNLKSFLSGQETALVPPACLWEVSCLFSCHFLFWLVGYREASDLSPPNKSEIDSGLEICSERR